MKGIEGKNGKIFFLPRKTLQNWFFSDNLVKRKTIALKAPTSMK